MNAETAIPRRYSRQIQVGSVAIGGEAPISVQTMTNTDTRDAEATLAQIRDVQQAGADLVRVAVVDDNAAQALQSICAASSLPVIADIHFDYRLAIRALDAGVAGLRINPGNIGGRQNVQEVVKAARDHGNAPIRIGVNGGSLEKELLETHGSPTPEALVESALRHVAILEDAGYDQIKISAKATDVIRTVETYRLLAARTNHPLHLGVTEAGTFLPGTIRSSIAMGILLAEGIGDTLRVSLTDSPEKEVKVGLEILRSLHLRKPGPSIISCPTCGRIEVDVVAIAEKVESELEALYRDCPDATFPTVAVMGCMVNGPGEAREAQLALAGGKGKFALYRKGCLLATIPEPEAVAALVAEVRAWLQTE